MADPQLKIRISAELGELRRSLNSLGADLRDFKARTERSVAGVGDGLRSATRAVAGLAASLGATLSASALIGLSDEAQTLTARLRIATRTQEEFNRAQNGTFDIAQRTRNGLKTTIDLYARLERSTRSLNVSQGQLLQLTDTISKAGTLSGGGPAVEAALMQFGQLLQSGDLSAVAQEINSIQEQAPRLAEAIRKGLDELGIKGPQSLKKLVSEGGVQVVDILNAILNQTGEVDAEFAKLPATIGGGFTKIRNALVNFIAESPAAATAARTIGEALGWVAENIAVVAGALAGVATAVALAFAPGAVAAFAGAIKSLWLTIIANPFLALAAAVASVVVAFTVMRDEISLGVDDTATLGDLMRAMWEDIAGLAKTAADAASDYFSGVGDDSRKAAGDAEAATSDSAKKQEAWWLKLLRVVAQVFDMIGGVIRGVMMGVYETIATAVRESMKSFEALANVGKSAFRFNLGATKAAIDNYKATWVNGAKNIAGAFGETFRAELLNQSDGGLEAWLDDLIERAKVIGKDRAGGGEPAGGGDEGPVTGGEAPAGTGGGKASAYRADLELLRDFVDRSIAENDRLYEAGLVSAAEYFRRKEALQLQAIDAAIEQAREELRVATGQEEQQRALVAIEKLQRDRAEVAPRAAREQAAAEQALADKLELVKAQIAELSGEAGAEARAQLKQELSRALEEAGNNPELRAAYLKLFDLRAVRAELDTLRGKIQDTIGGLRGTEGLVAAQQDAGQLDPQEAERVMQGLREQSIEQLTRYREALAALPGASENPEIIRSIQEVDTEIARITASLDQMRQQVASQAIDSVSNLFMDLVSGSKSAGDALRDFVRGFALGMAQIAARALATYAVLKLLDAIYPGLGKATAATMGVTAGVMHTGGPVGYGGGASRTVDPALFIGAPRFHTGGAIGLKQNEVPIIAERGEFMLSKGDPRNPLNGGGRSGPGTGTRVINVLDPSLVQDYLDSAAGEETVLNIIGRNPGRVRQIVG